MFPRVMNYPFRLHETHFFAVKYMNLRIFEHYPVHSACTHSFVYGSINDKSQLPCKSGWTLTGPQALNIHLGLTVRFYDTGKHRQAGDPCSVCFIFLLLKEKYLRVIVNRETL